MVFKWIKKIFNKNIKHNYETSDVATIDTSLVFVPKFSDLTIEEKNKVMNDINDLNRNSDYETIVKFSSDLVDISNRERVILTKTLDRYHEWFNNSKDPSFDNSNEIKMGDSICYGILSNMEFEIIVKKLLEIKKELELKVVAIDLFIAQKERKVFKDLFKHANRVEYKKLKTRLLNEKERIKVSLKINDQILRTIYIDIKENDTLRKEYAVLQQILDNTRDKTNNNIKKYILDSLNFKLYQYSHKFIGTEFDNIFLTDLKAFGKKMIGKKTPQIYITKRYDRKKPITYAKFFDKMKIINENMVDDAIRTATLNGDECSFDDLIDLIPDVMFEDFFKFVASVFHNMEVYCYNHQEDYKKYMDVINEIINYYETTPTNVWNEDELIELKTKYENDINAYFILLENYLNDENKSKVMNTYSKLVFLYNIKCSNDNIKKHSYLGDFYNEFEKRIYQVFTNVEDKYGVSLYDKRDILSRLKFLYDNQDYLIYLYDLLQGNTDIVKTKLDVSNNFNNKINTIINKSNLYCFSFNTMWDRSMSTEEYYYLSKLMQLPYDVCYKEAIEGTNLLVDKEACDTSFAKFLTIIKLNELEKNFDDRILVIPSGICFYKKEKQEYQKFLTKVDDLKINDNQIALFLSNPDQIETIVDISNNSQTIKYIMVKEKIFANYKKDYLEKLIYKRFRNYDFYLLPDDLNQMLFNRYKCLNYKKNYSIQMSDLNIGTWIDKNEEVANQMFEKEHKKVNFIIVPNNTEFRDLANYLDETLALEIEKSKVLSKKI